MTSIHVRKHANALAIVLSIAAISNAANAGGWTLTELGILPGNMTPTAINSSGQVAGVSDYSTSNPRPVLYTGGAMIDLGSLPNHPPYTGLGTVGMATAINDLGHVTGWSFVLQLDGGAGDVFLYKDGHMNDLGVTSNGDFGFSTPSAISNSGYIVGTDKYDWPNIYSHGVLANFQFVTAFPSSVNNSGHAVGYVGTSLLGDSRPFFYSESVFSKLGSLGGYSAFATDINDLDQIVGYSILSNDPVYDNIFHPFLYANGSMEDLSITRGIPINILTETSLQINNKAQILGFYQTPNGVTMKKRLFFSDGSKLTYLDEFFPELTDVRIIHLAENGDIAGVAEIGGEGHVFVIHAVPEPETYGLFLAGLGVLGAIARRRRA